MAEGTRLLLYVLQNKYEIKATLKIHSRPTNTQLVSALSAAAVRTAAAVCVFGGGGLLGGFVGGGVGSGPMAAQRLQLKVTWCDLTHSHPHLRPEEKFSLTRAPVSAELLKNLERI